MKFLIIAAAAALAVNAEADKEPMEDALVDVDQSITMGPTDEELNEVATKESEESWSRLRRACKRLKKYWYRYKHLGYSVRKRFYRASRKRIHGYTLKYWCRRAGVYLPF